jgi:3-methyladenine DNA glycosylase AlkC
MTTSMINTVTERVNEMKKNVEIQKIMMQFETNEEANNWIIKAAIATLMGVQN